MIKRAVTVISSQPVRARDRRMMQSGTAAA
jgi:hypothetical protein